MTIETHSGKPHSEPPPGAGEPAERVPPAADAVDVQHADAGMSTAPRADHDDIVQPKLGPGGWARWVWRQLTSMRVALILLLFLSLAAIPGSLIPQRPVSPIKVNQMFRDHPTRAKIYDKLDLFNVFGSWWFAAIYLLLFLSLVGCIVPRAWAHAKVLRGRPPKAPRNMDRLPAYASWETGAAPDAVLEAARAKLKGRRFRLSPSADSVAAEKGYLRETGNLLFHVALVFVLLAFLLGTVYKGSGNKILVEGGNEGFANSLTQYDDFQSGPWFDTKNMEPFGFKLTKLDQTFERLGTQRGAARGFEATVSYWQGDPDAAAKTGTIKVNEPLSIGGTRVYLLATGYAPDVTITDAKGKVAFSGPVVFLPQDGNRTSTGVIKVADVSEGLQQIGFNGIFTPTAWVDGNGWRSVFPSLDDPRLILNAFEGSLGVNSGVPQSVYRLNTERMQQVQTAENQPWAAAMKPGETKTLPDGTQIRFNGVKPWANFQVSKEPGKELALYSVGAAIVGLVLSLFIRRRRMWVRAVAGPDGRTVVEVAGLTRTEGGGLGQEVQALVDDLRASAPVAETADAAGADMTKKDEE